jgi:cytochrome b561
MVLQEARMAADGGIYSGTARFLHWFTAALVLIAIPAGITMVNIGPGALQNFLFDFHRSIGVLLIPVILLRLAYRLRHPPPPLPADIPAIQQFAASSVHVALYALLIVQPIVGWIGTSAFRAPINVFWLFVLPPIWPENRAFSDQVFEVHETIAYLIVLLLCAHVGAALFHHFVRRDRVLLRMWSLSRS